MADLSDNFLSEWLNKFTQEERLELTEKEREHLFTISSRCLKGLKDENEIENLLVKPLKIGGLEFNLETAKRVAKNLILHLTQAEVDKIVTAQEVKVGESGIEKRDKREEIRNKKKAESPEQVTGYRLQVTGQEPPARQPFIPSIQLYDQTAEELIKKSGLVVPAELRQRFKIIIISRLKDVRKLPEVRERLLASPAAGGVGLKAEEAERVMKMVEEERTLNSLNIKFVKREEKEKSEPISSVSPPIRGSQRGSESSQRPPLIPPDRGEISPSPPPSPPAPLKPATFSAKGGSASGGKPLNQLTSKPVLKPPVAAMPQIPPRVHPALGRDSLGRDDIRNSSDIKPCAPSTVKIIPQEKKPPKVELAPVPPAPVKPTQITAIPQTPAGRAKVEDVAYRPRLVGPLEELKEMSLLDFRRLAPQAKVTTDKIYAKIELLGQEGYAKKIKGIEAWQKSPVNRIYLAILNESIVQGKAVDKVIGSKETLSKEEFQAIMDLNRRLRF